MLLLFLGILLLTQFSHHPFWSSPRHGELEVEMQFLRRSWCFSWVTTSFFYISGMFHMLIVHLRSLHIITMPDKIGRCFFFHATTMKPNFSHAMAFWFTGLIPGCTYFSGKIWWFPYLQWTARSPGWRPKTIWNWSSRVVESSPGPSTVDSSWRKKGCRTLWILNWYFLQIVMLHFHQNITVQQMVSMTFSQFVGRLMLSQTSSVSVVNERGLVAMRVWVKFAYQASTKMHTLNGWKWGIPKSTWLLQNDVHPWRLDDLGLPPWLRKPKFKECGRFFGIRSLDQTKVFLENLVFFRRSNHFPAKSLEELTPKKPLLSDLQRIRIANQSLQIKWSLCICKYMCLFFKYTICTNMICSITTIWCIYIYV